MARPKKYDRPLVISAICERLAEGVPLEVICRDPGMPTSRMVAKWRVSDETINSAITRARDIGYDALASQCLEIADNETHDWKLTKKGQVTDEVAIGRARLQRRTVQIRTKIFFALTP